ncbi:DUF1492 domain-containing protein [Aminipila terrae]|uniref:DUF1492 domain-containing protein n=1 Tax=Aminipila terrae TaxID=2697030 RepID=A0A6P1MHJ4_9FIRM|nr:DUF1492 domain-containing protein [Aminipila terrae]QHI71478.1 DUF1492 domain-containing protein [Aminipila terrae]
MTKKELSQLYDLNREIEQQQNRLGELESVLQGKSVRVAGIPLSLDKEVSGCKSEILDLKELISLNMEKCWHEIKKINRFIDSVEDSKMRQILRLRYINGLTWQQIAFSIGEFDESYPRQKHNTFLKATENLENNC